MKVFLMKFITKELYYILQGIKLKTFKELATQVHNIVLIIKTNTNEHVC